LTDKSLRKAAKQQGSKSKQHSRQDARPTGILNLLVSEITH